MNRDLTEGETDDVLERQLYGHLACITHNMQPYIVPITYAYQNNAIYGFSLPGLKIDALREHPSVCFQTEEFQSEGEWKSVIVWGTYEELTRKKDELAGAKLLFQRLDREKGSATSPLYQPATQTLFAGASRILNDTESIFFRIRIERRTGKFICYE